MHHDSHFKKKKNMTKKTIEALLATLLLSTSTLVLAQPDAAASAPASNTIQIDDRLQAQYAQATYLLMQGEKADARAILENVAAANYAPAQTALAYMYYHGDGVAKDYGKARHWLEKAVAQNEADAQFLLGGMYFMGEGVSKNIEEAQRLFSLAAANGNEMAIDILGKIGQ